MWPTLPSSTWTSMWHFTFNTSRISDIPSAKHLNLTSLLKQKKFSYHSGLSSLSYTLYLVQDQVLLALYSRLSMLWPLVIDSPSGSPSCSACSVQEASHLAPWFHTSLFPSNASQHSARDILIKLKEDPVIPLLGVYPKDLKTGVQILAHRRVHSSLIQTAERWKESTPPWTDE